ncbi:MAG: hypothetical protein L3K17_08130, partial [Thermoplasmata archaeon]|nr:hypothetical protein [Thermoplasmata archaeon]
TWIMTRVSRDMFTRFVLGMDGLVVSFGLTQVLVKLKWLGSTVGYAVFGVLAAIVVALAAYSLYRLPGSQKLVDRPPPGGPPPPPGMAGPRTTTPAGLPEGADTSPGVGSAPFGAESG